MPVYNKIFTKILDSSIWLEPDSTRIVWLTCIAAMDEDGFVQFASVANLARRANVSLGAAQEAVARLEGPDAESSDPDHEGRRLERVQGGWIVLNAAKYRALVTRVVAREQTRVRVQRFRAKSNGEKRSSNAPVTPSEAVSEAVSRSEAATAKPQPKGFPLPGYRRLRLFRWMIDDLIAMLGDHIETFDLDAWLQAVDEDGSKVIPKTWPWLKDECSAECWRRGLVGDSFTSTELKHAAEVRKVRMGCRHDPRCSDVDGCVRLIAREVREVRG